MLEQFKEMVNQADMLHGFEEREDTINFMGENTAVVIVRVVTSETGDAVEAMFHKGTETLIDLKPIHVCTCGHCHH